MDFVRLQRWLHEATGIDHDAYKEAKARAREAKARAYEEKLAQPGLFEKAAAKVGNHLKREMENMVCIKCGYKTSRSDAKSIDAGQSGERCKVTGVGHVWVKDSL